MNPTNPIRIWPEFWRWGQTRPDSTRFWKNGSGSNLVCHGYIIGLNPNLNPFWGQPQLIGPIFWILRANMTCLKPKIGPKIGLNLKKQVGFGRTTHHRWLYNMINGPIRKSCQKFVHSFMNNECHEKDDNIDCSVNDGNCKSWLVFIQVKISTGPRNIHKQKITIKASFVWHVYHYYLYFLNLNLGQVLDVTDLWGNCSLCKNRWLEYVE